jgi:hypothetical protein
MGIDFLNVKELGLDIHIPTQLWKRKSEGSGTITARVKRSLLPM